MKNERVPVEKNETYKLEIETLGSEGEGIAKINGYAIFVEGGIPGDFVEVKVLKVKKNFGYGKIMKILKPSEDRIEPVCQIAEKCGGCQLQHLNYEAQLEFKRNKVEQALKRIGGLEDVIVSPTIGMEEPYYYRNKGQFPVSDDNGMAIGFYAARSHRIIPLEICHIQNWSHVAIIQAVSEYMVKNKVNAYNEEKHTGLVRHIAMRQSHSNGAIHVTLVINGNNIPNPSSLIDELKKVEGVSGISLNINREKTNVILGNKTLAIYKDAYIIDKIGDAEFRISPQSFYQVNPVQTEKLYQKALEFADLKGEEVVWDAYCGIGTITLFLAKKAKQVYGVEIVPEAIVDANYNKQLNGIENVEFFVGKAEEIIEKKHKEGIVADVMVVDPPRKGCEESLLLTMLKMKPSRIVYVSCDPATLARDVKVLVEGGYEVERVQPVDMFPMTVHVECVVALKWTSNH